MLTNVISLFLIDEQALRKERLCVKLVPRHTTETAICDVIIQGKSKHGLASYTYIGWAVNLISTQHVCLGHCCLWEKSKEGSVLKLFLLRSLNRRFWNRSELFLWIVCVFDQLLFPIVPLSACGPLQASWVLAVLILLLLMCFKPTLIFLSSVRLYLTVGSWAAQYIEMIKISQACDCYNVCSNWMHEVIYGQSFRCWSRCRETVSDLWKMINDRK